MSSDFIPLLTVHLFLTDKISKDKLKEPILGLKENHITVKMYGPDDPLVDAVPRKPRVYVSIGDDWKPFATLNSLPIQEKKRWLHFHSPDELESHKLFYCWIRATDPLPENKAVPPARFSSDTPLISVFTASYRSKERIQRPYRSLLNQTYPNWEWVIVDDSGDNEETYKNDLLPLNDPRVRRYRQDSRNGYIGAIKRYAAGLCTGEILVEVDHDDDLMPDCLEKIVKTFQQNPECGFVYGDCTEVYAENLHAHWYGWDCGFGYSVFYRVWLREMNRWQNAHKHTTINGKTVRHLVGLPNHPRAWSRDCYHLVGGHRDELLVADDYDMLIRTFLCSKFAAVPDLLYIQYRNERGSNTTFLRNKQIQILVRELERVYHDRIQSRLTELELPEHLPNCRIWETSVHDPARKTAHVIHEDTSRVSILFPIPYSHPEREHTQLSKTLQRGMKAGFKNTEVIVVGHIPKEVEFFASQAPAGAIRWWPMEPDDSLETCIQYAKYCASCKEKVVVMP
ncbi:glycosyltransferase [Paenibacillus alvei]|uniref:glycosyltransferase n=1 Tax=Paenibacillus alvei TaxID=44250 RepID=UPI000593BC19|nr:glycosyltransferase [Paenibacillus alvei]MCY9540870.1 glycosyltransferase [Paenibacillus alvei]MCY9705989.1 glycosyltransferase [Paenibacillus alvei]MCY9737698.1 glycosyltransferase [Paenibacillus alvei]MCY9754760.1 glycosyltransferase [Paenibacillus alvei]MEC0083832.1 glycosyltransferase [Paenibacillus alvei]